MDGKIRGIDATTTEKGVLRIATQDEVNTGTVKDAVVTPETLKNFPQPTPSYVPIPLEAFISDKVAKANHAYAAIDSKNTLTLQLPPRGSFKRSDILEVENLSAPAFKITLNADLLIRYDNTVIEDIDGRFLLSEGPGSSIKLRAESTQLWYVVRRDRVTISSNPANSQPKNVLPIDMYLKRNAKESFTFDGTGAEYHIRLPKFAEVGEINDITFTNKGTAQLAQRPHWAPQGVKDDYYVSPQMTVKIGDMQTTRGHNGVTYIKGPAHIKLKCTRRHLINPESIKNRTIQYWEMDFEALEWSGDIKVK